MTGDPAPVLSVVVPSVNGWGDLEGCLAALAAERAKTPLEVLVPERCGEAVRDAVTRYFPWVRLLPVPAGLPIPGMRARATAEAQAPTVVILEDHILVPAGWARRVADARTETSRVVGGGLVNAATGRVVDWAAFFCEYSELIEPQPAGPASRLPGNHTAYERALLDEFRGVLEAGGWEDALHDALRARGVVLWRRPDLVAAHKKHYRVSEYMAQRFLYARAYAAARVGGAGGLTRAGYGLLALGLPPVLLARIVRRVWRSGAHRADLVRALPLLALFVLAWGAGETVGAWGGGGDALARVR